VSPETNSKADKDEDNKHVGTIQNKAAQQSVLRNPAIRLACWSKILSVQRGNFALGRGYDAKNETKWRESSRMVKRKSGLPVGQAFCVLALFLFMPGQATIDNRAWRLSSACI
jgi:hypothetical protein